MVSRIAWLVVAALVLGGSCIMGLLILPGFGNRWQDIYPGQPMPNLTRMLFEVGPVTFITLGTIAALVVALGEFRPVFRGMRQPFLIAFVLLGCFTAAAVFFALVRIGTLSSVNSPPPAVPNPSMPAP